ncbi:MAG: hypothetical protein KDA52_09810 [Planctomycetaceae bacterium]|nr:hypothetical protein [Planctomycetaceae bacterium]
MNPALAPREIIERQVAAHEAASREYREKFLQLSMEERGRKLSEVCEMAVKICQSRVASGMPPCRKAPVPAHALEILSRPLRESHVRA